MLIKEKLFDTISNVTGTSSVFDTAQNNFVHLL